MDKDDLRFSAEHVWVRIDDDDRATIGLTEEAFQDGDEITKIKLPSEGEELIKDETAGRLTTSRPSVVRLYAPVSGDVTEVNEEILEAPEMILEDPYEEGWLFRMDLSNMTEYDDLMTDDEYEDFIGVGGAEEEKEELDEDESEENDDDL